MGSKSIRCNAISATGQLCGATAAVAAVQYKYAAELQPRTAEIQQVLIEAVYEIDCPTCGPRTQCERQAGSVSDRLLA